LEPRREAHPYLPQRPGASPFESHVIPEGSVSEIRHFLYWIARGCGVRERAACLLALTLNRQEEFT
jgi:hypothetical protein